MSIVWDWLLLCQVFGIVVGLIVGVPIGIKIADRYGWFDWFTSDSFFGLMVAGLVVVLLGIVWLFVAAMLGPPAGAAIVGVGLVVAGFGLALGICILGLILADEP